MSHMIFSIMPMFICLFWVVLLLIDRQQTNLSKRFLFFFLSLAFVNYFTHALYFNHQYELYSLFDSIWCFTSLAAFPLYYYYIRLLTKDIKINYRWAWILVHFPLYIPNFLKSSSDEADEIIFLFFRTSSIAFWWLTVGLMFFSKTSPHDFFTVFLFAIAITTSFFAKIQK